MDNFPDTIRIDVSTKIFATLIIEQVVNQFTEIIQSERKK